MIREFNGRHKGQTVALVGSSPSALNFKGEEDIAICLNGAIEIEHDWDYFVGFDYRLPHKPFWDISRGETRILGAAIARMDYRLYREPETAPTEGNSLYDEWLEENPPMKPHAYFYYENRDWGEEELDISQNHLTHNGSVAHVGLEFAYRLEPSSISIYGIEMNQRQYFNTERLGGSYGSTYIYMNELIQHIKKDGVEIKLFNSPDSKLHL